MTKQTMVDPETGELLFSEGEEFSESRLVAMLHQVYDLGRRSKSLGDAYSTAKKPYLEFLLKNGEKALRDGETGTSAVLQEPMGEECDVATLAEEMPGALIEAAKRGLLRLDVVGFKRQKETFQYGESIARYVYPKPMTARVVIQKER